MSSDGTYSGRASRRADREPPAAKRASAGAATAILIIVAIFGFGGGVLLGNASGAGEQPQDPSATQGDGATEAPESSPSEADSTGPAESDSALSLSSPMDGGQVAPGEDGRFEMAGSIDPPVGGIVITIERSLDGGETWGQAGSSTLTATTSDDGTYSTTFWSGQEGENHFRAIGEDSDGNRMESNTIAVTVASDGD